MTPTAPETLSDVEIFRYQARMVHKILRINVDGITQEESLIQPQPGGNCLNWVVGHLVGTYGKVLPLLGQEPAMEESLLERYDRGASPLMDPAGALELQDLLTAWDETSRRIDAGLKGLTPEILDRPAPASPTGNPNETVRTLLATIFFHQAYHAGQVGILRRLAGKEGAIR